MKTLAEKFGYRQYMSFCTLVDVHREGTAFAAELLRDGLPDTLTIMARMRYHYVSHFEGRRFCDYDETEEFSFEEAYAEFCQGAIHLLGARQ